MVKKVSFFLLAILTNHHPHTTQLLYKCYFWYWKLHKTTGCWAYV